MADPRLGRKERGRAEEMQKLAWRCGCCGCAAAVQEETPSLQPSQSNPACLGTPELVRGQRSAPLDHKKPTLVSAVAHRRVEQMVTTALPALKI